MPWNITNLAREFTRMQSCFWYGCEHKCLLKLGKINHKFLQRLLHRLKDRNLAREGVPESQESEVMRLSLADRPYDTDDKRKPKRPPPRPKSHTSDTTVDITSTSATVPQPAVRQNIGITPAPGAPGLPLNAHPMILQGLVQPQAFPGPDYTVPENLLNETIVHSVQRNASAQQLATASPAFFEEFNVDLRECKWNLGIKAKESDGGVNSSELFSKTTDWNPA